MLYKIHLEKYPMRPNRMNPLINPVIPTIFLPFGKSLFLQWNVFFSRIICVQFHSLVNLITIPRFYSQLKFTILLLFIISVIYLRHLKTLFFLPVAMMWWLSFQQLHLLLVVIEVPSTTTPSNFSLNMSFVYIYITSPLFEYPTPVILMTSKEMYLHKPIMSLQCSIWFCVLYGEIWSSIWMFAFVLNDCHCGKSGAN